MRWGCVLVIMASASPLAAADLEGTAAGRSRFVAQHRCAIVERLETMHRRGPVEQSRDRFIIVALRDQPQRYVQCIFHDRDRQMLCEASSGAYGPVGKDRLRLDPSAQAALRALGYVQADLRKNFSRDVALGDPPDVGIAANLMLTALHDGYGARPGSVIEITAPHGESPVSNCGTPVS